MNRIPLICTVMTPFPHSIDIDAGLRRARQMMVEHGIRHLPVMEKGRLVGVLTDRDLKRALDPDIGLPPGNELFVRDVCVLEAYVVDLHERLDTVALHMAREHIGSALVVKGGKLAGIFTLTDACRCLGQYLRAEFPTGGGDEAA